VTTVKITDLNVTTGKLAAEAVTTAKIADLNVTTGKIANNAVTDVQAGERVAQFYRRQGGDASNWSTPGSTTYTPALVRMQAGTREVTVLNTETFVTETITFPVAFSAAPVVLLTLGDTDFLNSEAQPVLSADAVTAAGFDILVITADGVGADGDKDVAFYWLAIGTE